VLEEEEESLERIEIIFLYGKSNEFFCPVTFTIRFFLFSIADIK